MNAWVWFGLSGLFVWAVYFTARLVVDRVAERRFERQIRYACRQQLRYQAWADCYKLEVE